MPAEERNVRRRDPFDGIAADLGMTRLEVLIGLKDRLYAQPVGERSKSYIPAMRKLAGLLRSERKRIAAEIGADEPMSGAIDVASQRRRS